MNMFFLCIASFFKRNRELPNYFRLNSIIICLSVLLFINLALPYLVQGSSPQTEADAKIEKNKITVVYCHDSIPFHYTNSDDQAEGLLIDYWNLWSEKTNIDIAFVPAAWNDTLAMMRDGKADAHAGLFFNEERAKYLDYGNPLRKTDTHIFYDKRLPAPVSNQDFIPHVIGLISGDFVEAWLENSYPNAKLSGFRNYEALMAALKRQEIMVFAADTPTALFHLQQSGIKQNFRHRAQMPLYQSDWFVAVKKGNKELLETINRGFDAVTPQERKAIGRQWATGTKKKNTGDLIVSISTGYPPFSFIGLDGNPAGLLVDIWRLWSRETGTPMVFKAGNWAETLEAVRTGEADIHSGLFKNEDRAKWFSFSMPIFEAETAVYYLADREEPLLLKDANGKPVGAMRGSQQEAFLRNRFPEINVVPGMDDESLILSLLKGDIDAFVHEAPVVAADLSRLGLTGMITRGETLFGNEIHAGIVKGRRKLQEHINDGFENLPEDRLAAMEARWLPNAPTRFYKAETEDIGLTSIEKKWIRANPLIKVAATPNWPPFEFKEKGRYKGLHADVLRLAAKKAGLEVIPVFGKWSDLVEQLKNGQLDLCPGLNATDKRKKYLVFTDDWVSESSQVIISPTDNPIESIEDLDGKSVSVEKGYAAEAFLKKNYPNVKLLLVNSTIEALKAVITGKAHAYFGNQAVALYLIKKNTFSGLGVTAFFEEARRSHYRIGVVDDKPVLRDILQKALTAITTEEMTALQEKWFGVAMARQAAKPDLKLTEAEKNWIQDHSKIRIASVSDWPPFEFKDENGHYAGITVDILRLAADRAVLEIEPVFDKWPALYRQLQQKKLDIAPGLVKNKERSQHLLFTDSFAHSEDVIWTRESEKDITTADDLKEKKLVVEKDYYNENILKNRYPKAQVLSVANTLEALETLSKGEADAYVGSKVVATYVMEKSYIDNIKVVTRFGSDPLRLRMGIRNDAPILHSILQKALDSITQKERMDIIVAYVPSLVDQEKFKPVELSPEEKAWVRAHRKIRLGVDPAFPPFEVIDPENGYGGIVSEYVGFFSKQLDVKMTPLHDLSWQEAIKMAKAGELDILPGLVKSPEREKYLNFTKPYLSFPVVIFGHKEGQFISGLKDLKGMKVGVVGGYYINDFLSADHPELNLTLFDTIDEALLSLSKGSLDAFINDMASTSYTINSLNIPNLNVAAMTPYTLDLTMGVRKDWPEMVPILEKAMETVTPQLADEFKDKWLSLKFTVGLSLKTVLKWALPIAGGLSLIIFVIVLWNRRLDKEISDRKKAQADLADAFGVITSSINYASRIQRSILPTADMMSELLDEHFILWKPRDVVGGDIYWGRKWGEGSLVLLADCTGHGVPGAFMTLISSGALDRALLDVPAGDAATLIQRMHRIVQHLLSQDVEVCDDDHCSDDGLELGVCYIQPTKDSITFAGAGFPLFYTDGDGMKKIKGDRKGIGYRHIPQDTNWTNRVLDVKKGMSFYMSSDGIFDQIGGPKNRGFGKKRFMKLLDSVKTDPIAEQGDAIYRHLVEYQGDEKRRDDVSAIGFKI